MVRKKVSLKSRLRTFTEIMKIYGAAIIAAVLIMIGAYQFVAPAPPQSFTIATASKDGAYYRYAQEYRALLAQENIDLKVVVTSGSADNLGLLAKGDVDAAFVQSGVGDAAKYPDVTGLASLYMEPLLIFTRKGDRIDTLLDAADLRLGIGPEGSGTRAIMLSLLADNKLDQKLHVTTSPLGGEKAVDALLAGEVDVVFMVSRPDTPAMLSMLANPGISLVSLPRAEAYARRHSYLSHLVLPRGVFDLALDLPARDIHCIAPAATLVAGTTLHPALTDLLMQVIKKVHGHGVYLSRDVSFPAKAFLDFPLNKEAERFFKYGPPFLQRYLPFWAASLIDRLKVMLLPLIALIVPLMKILPPTYRWRIRSRIYRSYDELHALDQKLGSTTTSVDLLKEGIVSLEKMESEVRQLEVPLSYAEELYHLRLHIDLLKTQLLRRLG